jgi:hypothetical protein
MRRIRAVSSASVRSTSASDPGRSSRRPANRTRPARHARAGRRDRRQHAAVDPDRATTTAAPRRERRRLRRRQRRLETSRPSEQPPRLAAPATPAAIASTRYRRPTRAHAHQAPHKPRQYLSLTPAFPHRSPPPRHAPLAAPATQARGGTWRSWRTGPTYRWPERFGDERRVVVARHIVQGGAVIGRTSRPRERRDSNPRPPA